MTDFTRASAGPSTETRKRRNQRGWSLRARSESAKVDLGRLNSRLAPAGIDRRPLRHGASARILQDPIHGGSLTCQSETQTEEHDGPLGAGPAAKRLTIARGLLGPGRGGERHEQGRDLPYPINSDRRGLNSMVGGHMHANTIYKKNTTGLITQLQRCAQATGTSRRTLAAALACM